MELRGSAGVRVLGPPALDTALGVCLSGGSEQMGASRAAVRPQGIPCRPSDYKHRRAEEKEEGKLYLT